MQKLLYYPDIKRRSSLVGEHIGGTILYRAHHRHDWKAIALITPPEEIPQDAPSITGVILGGCPANLIEKLRVFGAVRFVNRGILVAGLVKVESIS